MKKQWRVKAGLCLCVVLVFSVLLGVVLMKPTFLEKIKDDKNSVALNIDANTEEDYVILEIVPDISYAQLGYWVAGSEPVEIFQICEAGGEKYEALKKLLGNNAYEEVSGLTQNQYNELEEIYGTSTMEKYFPAENVTGSGISGKRYTYQFTGESFLVNKNLLETKLEAEGIISAQGKSKVKVLTYTASELNEATDASLAQLLDATDFIFVNQSYAKDIETQQKKLANLGDGKTANTFLTEDLEWNVVEKIFSYVADKDGCTPIIYDESIYTNALADASVKTVDTHQYIVDRTVKYHSDGSAKSDVTVTDLIKEKTGSGYTKSNVAASNNNAYKLFLMSAFRDPAEFYNIFFETERIQNGKTKLQSASNADTYWSTYSFVPTQGDLNTDTSTDPGDEAYWKSDMAIGVTLPSKNYVNCNVLSLYTDSASFVSLLSNTESFAKLTNTSGTDSTLAAMVAQIEEYEPKAYTDGKTFNVLELEPANGFEDTKELAVKIDRLIPYNTYSNKSTMKLTITQMTTAEFIGKTDDLASSYDMIYIGDCIDGLFKKDGKAYYGSENSDMTGVIYAHVGARSLFQYDNRSGKGTSSTSASGKSNGYALFASSGDSLGRQSSGELRYSGNDITSLKKTALENYVGTDLPVAVAASLMTDVSNTSESSSSMDSSIKKTDYFYDTTYNNMYQFIKDNKSEILSLAFNYRIAKEDELDKQLNRLTAEKPSLTINSMYSVNDSYGSDKLEDNLIFTFDSTTSNRKISFNYTIDSKKYTKFYATLYVDKNADGIYDTAEEKVGQKSCSNGTNTFTFSLNTNYHGAFSWKLEVRPTTNPGMKISQIGYGTIRFSDTSATARTVHVLQVQAVKASGKHATSWGLEKAHNVQLTYDDSGKNSQTKTEAANDKSYGAFDQEFYDLLHSSEVSKDFDIKVTLINLQEFCYGASGSNSNGKWYDTYYGKNMSRADLQSSYDMIIFGFADSYRDMELNSRKCAQDVEAYIDAGKSVLFTHDLTSEINNENILGETEASRAGTYMETSNGKGFNRYLRDAMGLNRFGQNVSATNGSLTGKGYDKTKSKEEFGFTYSALMQYCNFRFSYSGASNSSMGYRGPYKNLYENFKSSNAGWPDIDQGYATTRVTNVNNGQITKYPYDLSEYKNSDDTYTIAKTHGQYYQLNMEDSDVVCWYTLSDESSSGWYRTSPNDVSNNYYIYNKGNVTYTGVGHSTAKSMTTFEKKLFVNTIIAALRAGVEGPTATITNGVNVPENGEDCFVVYADVDADSPEEDFRDTEKVVFYAEDDAVSDDYVYVAIELDEDGDGTYEEKSRQELADMGFGNGLTAQVITKASNNTSSLPVEYIDNKTIKIGTSSTETKHHVWKIARSTSTKEYDYVLNYARGNLLDAHSNIKSSEKFRIVVYDTANAIGYVNGALVCRKVFTLD